MWYWGPLSVLGDLPNLECSPICTPTLFPRISWGPTHLFPEAFPEDSSSYQIPLIWTPTPLIYCPDLTVIIPSMFLYCFTHVHFAFSIYCSRKGETQDRTSLWRPLSSHTEKKHLLLYLKNDSKEDRHQTYFLSYFWFLSFFHQHMVLGISCLG